MNKIEKDFVKENIFSLEKWISVNGFKGYDPYDLQEFLYKYFRFNFLIKSFNQIAYFFPVTVRKIFCIKKAENAKAMGLFFSSYLVLHKITKNKEFLNKSLKCKEWLINNAVLKNNWLGWGYPFDWKTKVFIPKGTPSSVVTAIIGEGFYRDFEYYKNKDSLDVCKKICSFFINGLRIDEIDDRRICFSYTPIDNFHVHNANLFVAEFLIKIGLLINNQKFIDFGKKAVNYTVSEQNEDGSIFYWGRIQNEYNPNHLDHYHTGFELRMLYSISKLLHDSKYVTAFNKYYDFYQHKFFSENGFFKYSPIKEYPVNIHACAEALLCKCVIKDKFNQLEAYNLYKMIDRTMKNPKGYYNYMIKKFFGLKVKSKIPFIRWGQAWMFRALAEFYMRINE